MSGDGSSAPRRRPRVAFFDHADAFEDFYPHYGVSQAEFAHRWHGSGSHAFIRLIQASVADVVWYEFSLEPKVPEATHEWCGCRVRFVATSCVHRLLWRAFYLSRHSWRLRPWYRQFSVLASYTASLSMDFLGRLFRDRPDALFCQDYSNGRFDLLVLLGRLFGMRVVAYHAGSTPQHYVGGTIKRWTIRHADKVLVSSRREADMLATDYRVPRDRLDVVLTPIDTEVFKPLDRVAACLRAGLDPSRRYVVFVGRLDDRIKRVNLLIDSFSKLADRFPDVVLLVAGDGSDRDRLCSHGTAVAGDAVRFLGWRSGAAELVPLYCAAECLVLVSRSEGFPTVIGEAMACGTPVIGTDVGGVSELVEAGFNGWLLPAAPDELVASELERALSGALGTPGLASEMREHARETAVARVSHAAVLDKLDACLGVRR